MGRKKNRQQQEQSSTQNTNNKFKIAAKWRWGSIQKRKSAKIQNNARRRDGKTLQGHKAGEEEGKEEERG